MAVLRLVRRLIDAGPASERPVHGTSLKVTHVHGRVPYRALGIESFDTPRREVYREESRCAAS